VDSQIFMPVMLTNRPSYGTLAKPTTPRHILHSIPTDSTLNTYRFYTDTKTE